LALGFEVLFFLVPEDREVVEPLLGLGEVWEWLRGEFGKFVLDRLAAGEVVAPVEVAELVQVTEPAQALFECGPPADCCGRLAGGGSREPVQDLFLERRFGFEVGDELDQLRFDDFGPDQRLVAALAGAAAGAQVARLQSAADRCPLHLALAAFTAGEAAEQVAGRGPPGLERARPRPA
jgi:hypothetical protein